MRVVRGENHRKSEQRLYVCGVSTAVRWCRRVANQSIVVHSAEHKY